MAIQPIPSFKVCTKCGESKPLGEFHKASKASKSRFNVQPQCKVCRAEARRPGILAERAASKALAAQGLKRCSVCGQTLPLSSFRLRSGAPDGLSYRCIECNKRGNINWRAKNPKGFDRWKSRNLDKRSEYCRSWREANKDHISRSYADWLSGNRHIVNANTAERNAAKLNATPSWADLDAIRAVYAEAARLTAETGVRHEVDHIYPLQGKTVCGLHIAANLQILTRSENARKKNRMPEDLGFA